MSSALSGGGYSPPDTGQLVTLDAFGRTRISEPTTTGTSTINGVIRWREIY